MERERIKQRLVGAVVLVALGVIFIPMILSGDRDEAMPPFGSNIPDKPREVTKLKKMAIPPAPTEPQSAPPPAVPIDEHSPPADDEAPSADSTDAQPAVSAEDETKTEAPDPKQPHGWVVQVGSFANRNNALRLEKQLRDKQFDAFVERVHTDKGTVYRVRVGPEVRRESAEQQQQQIAKAFDLKAVVMRHP